MWFSFKRIHSRFGEACGLSEVICLMWMPWQLRATKREMMAVLPNPTLPAITTPWLAVGSLLRRHMSTSWNSHSRPVKTVSGIRLGTSKRSGFRAMSGGRYGAKRTASWKTLGNVLNETGLYPTQSLFFSFHFLFIAISSIKAEFSQFNVQIYTAVIFFNQQGEVLCLKKARPGSLRKLELQCETPWISGRR